MSESGGKTYRPWEPQRYRQEAQSPAAKLPEGDLVFFLLDTVSQLDLRRFYAPYEQETRGAPPCDPAMLVCLLLSADCVGVFASRKIAVACERHLAFRALVGQDRPDLRTSSDVRTGLWRQARTGWSRWCVWRQRRVWCPWATCRPMARTSRAMPRGPRR